MLRPSTTAFAWTMIWCGDHCDARNEKPIGSCGTRVPAWACVQVYQSFFADFGPLSLGHVRAWSPAAFNSSRLTHPSLACLLPPRAARLAARQVLPRRYQAAGAAPQGAALHCSAPPQARQWRISYSRIFGMEMRRLLARAHGCGCPRNARQVLCRRLAPEAAFEPFMGARSCCSGSNVCVITSNHAFQAASRPCIHSVTRHSGCVLGQ